MNPTDASDTIVQEITIKAPVERIFEALTNPDQRLKWWGAEGQYRGTQMESDLRPARQMDDTRRRQRRQALHRAWRVPADRASELARVHVAA